MTQPKLADWTLAIHVPRIKLNEGRNYLLIGVVYHEGDLFVLYKIFLKLCFMLNIAIYFNHSKTVFSKLMCV